MLQIKVVQNKISYKKLSEHVPLHSLGVELGGSKDYHFEILISTGKGK